MTYSVLKETWIPPNNIKSYKIVVARYNEDVDWLLPEMKNVIIYNKGEPLKNTKMTSINIPNVGRESETYLHYIIDNYDNLPDVVCFTQGMITDHIRRVEPLDALKEFIKQAFMFGMSRPKKCATVGDSWSADTRPSWSTPAFCEGKKFDLQWKDMELKLRNNNKIVDFKKWFLNNISSKYPACLNQYKTGIFAVSKQQILSRPKSFYESIILEVNHDSNPLEGHYFERSWYYIFNEF